MAKSSNRGGGPGTADRHGVRTTMDSPWKNGADKGSAGGMKAPFNGGSQGSVPTHVYQPGMPGPGAGPKASSRDVPGTILTNPKGPRR